MTRVQLLAGEIQGHFLFTTASRPTLGLNQPPTPGVKLPVYEGDHSLPSTAEVKKAWHYTSTDPYVFMEWYLIKEELYLHGMVLS